MSKKLKRRLVKIFVGAVGLLVSCIIERIVPEYTSEAAANNIILIAFVISYLIIGGDVVKKAVANISRGQVFDENFLMMIATVGAFFVGEYPEAVAVMLFYQVGEWFQGYAVNKSRKSISDLMDIRPDYANVIRDGELIKVNPEEVAVGEIILVKPGEKIPLDGCIVKGNTTLDTMALTGESMPRNAMEGEEVISGSINIASVIEVSVEKEFGQSTVSKILDLVENAASKKAGTENFISRFAKYYTPIVVILAVVLAILPPLLIDGEYTKWIYRALTFLVVSCPCALVISIPLSFFGGIGGAGRTGILVKGSNYLEILSQIKTVVIDKTGTLTKGAFAVTKICPVEVPEEELLELAAYAESHSNHPISKSLLTAYEADIDTARIGSIQEIPGHGIEAIIDDKVVLVGNDKLMQQNDIQCDKIDQIGTVVHVALKADSKYLGYILIQDEIKADAGIAVSSLKAAGIKDIIMLTGDRRAVAEAVAHEVGIEKVFAELLPGDKVDKVEELLAELSGEDKNKLAFVGDGINDAPVLARADIGIAMGALGSDAAIEAADIVIMTDEPSKISRAIKISQKTLSIVKQNIVFAIGIKVLVLLLAAVGAANMWMAVFADVGVTVIAIFNAMRAMYTRRT